MSLADLPAMVWRCAGDCQTLLHYFFVMFLHQSAERRGAIYGVGSKLTTDLGVGKNLILHIDRLGDLRVAHVCMLALQSRPQVNRRHHAARAPTAKFNGREFKRHEPRITAQSFALLLGECSTGTSGKHQQFLSILIV